MLATLAFALLPQTVILERGAVLPGYGRYLAVEDTVLDSLEGDLWQGGASALLANTNKPLLIQFLDLQRAVGRNKRVTKATLEFVFTRGKPELARARRVLVPWTEGPIASLAGQIRGDDTSVRWAATYKMRRNGIDAIAWQSPGARGDSESEAIASAKGDLKDDKIVITGLESAVQTQLDRPFDNHGFALEFAEGTDLLSSSASEGRPRLILELEDKAPEKGPDLSVTLISRTPEYERYDDRDSATMAAQDGAQIPVQDNVKNAGAKHWPDEGEKLTYIAHIKNVGDAAAAACEGQWIDREVGAGIVKIDKALAPGEEATVQVEIPYRSSHTDHRVQPVGFRLFPKGPDASKGNDFLEIQQSALNIEVVVPKAAAAKIQSGGWAIEDWVQDQVRHWNDVTCRYSRYSFAPDGAVERIRVQALSLSDSAPAANLMYDAQIVVGEPDGFEHQLAEACGLVPLTTPLMNGGGKTADGTPVPCALDRFPGLGGGGEIRSDALLIPTLGFPYDAFSDLIMDPDKLEPVGPLAQTEVYGLNRNVGRRRGYMGDYLYDIPATVILTLTDMAGRKIPNADVTAYQLRNGTFDGAAATFQLKTSEGGTFAIPSRPTGAADGFYTATGHRLAPNPFGRIAPNFSNGAYLIKATANGVTATAVLKLWQVVDAAARARRPIAMLNLRLNVPSVPLAESALAISAKGPTGPLPALTDGNLDTAAEPPAWIDLDLGDEKTVGEVSVVPKTVGDWSFDIVVYGANEKPGIGRPFSRERDMRWSLASPAESGTLTYRGAPQKGRYVRIVSKGPASGVQIGEIRIKAVR